MAEYMTLMGAEQVQRAGSSMATAAEKMEAAAGSISWSVDRLVRALEEHAQRIEAAMNKDQP
jgi:hypothetical protein